MWSEVISIEEVGDMDMIDIEVSGNHLFYANDILTHNSNSDVGLEDTSESFGLPATADTLLHEPKSIRDYFRRIGEHEPAYGKAVEEPLQ